MVAPLSLEFPQPDVHGDDTPLLSVIDLLGENSKLLNTSKPSYDLQEYYCRNAHVSSQITLYSTTRGALLWMNRLAKQQYSNAVKICTTFLEFDQAWANDVAPHAPSRMVTFKESARKFNMGRKGLGVQVQSGWHLSKRGQMIWQFQLIQVAKGMDDSILLQTIEAILNAKPYLETLAETTGINYSQDEYLNDLANMFAFFQKAKGGFQNFIPEAKQRIRRQDGDFDHVILNEQTFNYLSLVPVKSSENMDRVGDNMSQLLEEGSVMKLGVGVDALIFPPIYIDNNVGVDLLQRRDQCGSHNLMYDKQFGQPGYVYDSRHLAIEIYDNKKNSIERLNLETAVKESGIGDSFWKTQLTKPNPDQQIGLDILKHQTIDDLLIFYKNYGSLKGIGAAEEYADQYRIYLAEQLLARHLGVDYKKKLGYLRSAFRNGLLPLATTNIAADRPNQNGYKDLNDTLNELNELFIQFTSKMVGDGTSSTNHFTFFELILSIVGSAEMAQLETIYAAALAPVGTATEKNSYESEISKAMKSPLLSGVPRFYVEIMAGMKYKTGWKSDTFNGTVFHVDGMQHPPTEYTDFISQGLKFIYNDRRTLLSFVGDHLPIPYAWYVTRENAEYAGNAAICIAGGEKTIKRYKGDPIFTIGQDSIQQGMVGHLTCWCGTDVHTPKNLIVFDSVHLHRHVRGNGSIVFEFDRAAKDTHGSYYDPKNGVYGDDGECCVKFLALAPFEIPTLPNPMSVTGNFDDQLRGIQLQKTRSRQDYTTAAAYRKLWKWPVGSAAKISTWDRIEQAPINYVTWLGYTRYFRPNNIDSNGRFDDVQPETGHFAGITHENCASYRCGTIMHSSEIQKTSSIHDRVGA